MINKIGVIGNINVTTRPTFKSSDARAYTTPSEIDIKTPEAMANYGVAAINMTKKFDIKPLEPIFLNPDLAHTIKGERIYSSNGKLHSITDENDKIKTVYIPNKDNENFFDEIITTDKETGNVINRQTNYVKDGKYYEIRVAKYSKKTGNIEAETIYYDNKLYSATKYITTPSEGEESISYNYQDKDYAWYKSSINGDHESYTRISKDLKFINFSENKKGIGREIEVEASFYNGGMISLNEEKRIIIPNILGQEYLNNKDLKPAKKYSLNGITPDFEGEKTYYSNGAVESITIPDGTAFFEPDGKLSKLKSPTIEIEVGADGYQQITENLNNNTTKTTTYCTNHIIVGIENEDFYKELKLNSELKPSHYSETNKKTNSEISLYYNEQGMLKTAYNF